MVLICRTLLRICHQFFSMVCKDEKETAIVKSNNCCENLVLQVCVGKKLKKDKQVQNLYAK